MDEVIKYPTAAELDDYSEYKRLRRIYRESKHKGIAASAEASKGVPGPAKIAPTIPPPASATLGARSSLFAVSPAGSRTTTGTESQQVTPSDAWPPKSPTTTADEGVSAKEYPLASHNNPVLRTGTHREKSPTINEADTDATANSSGEPRIDIKEVAPWIDVDLPTVAVSSSQNLSSSRRSTARDFLSSDQAGSPIPANSNLARKKSPTPTQMLGHGARVQSTKKGARISLLSKGKNPMAKLFDGSDDESTREADLFLSEEPEDSSNIPTRNLAASAKHTTSLNPSPSFGAGTMGLSDQQASSSLLNEPIHDTAMVPSRYSTEDWFLDEAPLQIDGPPPLSLEPGTHAQRSAPGAAQTVGPSINDPLDIDARRMEAVLRLENVVKTLQGLQNIVAFRDPFGNPSSDHNRDQSGSSNVSPETIP